MSNHLQRLGDAGRRLVTPELGRGEIERYQEEVYRSFVEPLPRAIDLDAFDDAITEILASTPKWESGEIDPRAAVEIHRTLPLSRREAADWGVWRYLAVIHRPDFIRHRWEFRSWTTIQARFWQRGTRPDSNTIGRLWWVAELSAVGRDYSLTRRVLVTQSLTKSIFIRTLSDYPVAVQAAVDVLEDKPTEVAEQVLLRLHRYLSTMPLEGMTREELVGVIRGWVVGERERETPAHDLYLHLSAKDLSVRMPRPNLIETRLHMMRQALDTVLIFDFNLRCSSSMNCDIRPRATGLGHVKHDGGRREGGKAGRREGGKAGRREGGKAGRREGEHVPK